MDIKDLRERAGLSQTELAGLLGITPSNYGRLEKGRRGLTRIQRHAACMAAYLSASGQLEQYRKYARAVAKRYEPLG